MDSCARRIKQLDVQRDPLRFFLAVGAFSGLISMTVHSLFDFNLQIPANCLYFVVLMAVLSACTPTGRISNRRYGTTGTIMIDLHCHILHGLDDGPETAAESMQMARTFERAGYRTVAATPHMVPGTAWMPATDRINAQVAELNPPSK
jgi:hypothetical protein